MPKVLVYKFEVEVEPSKAQPQLILEKLSEYGKAKLIGSTMRKAQ